MSSNKIIGKAIQLINSDAEFSIDNHDIDTIEWHNDTTPIAKSDIEARLAEAEQAIADEEQAEIDNKASAKNKLMNGEALTEDEANVMVGL